MPNTPTDDPSVIDAIPEPEAVKARLTRLAAEARLLRPLLRLAEQKARERQREERGMAHAS